MAFESRIYSNNGMGGGGGSSFTGTPNRAVVTDGAGALASATTTATEIGYVNGVTGAIQTQIDAKAPLASPTFTGTVTTSAITANGTATFNGDIAIKEQGGGSDLITIQAAASAAARTYTIPDAGGAASFVMTAGTQTIGGAKTFSSDVVCGSGTASTTTTTGALQVTGGIGATGAVNHAGTYRCTNTTDSTAFSNGSAVFSGGVGVTKTLFVGTGIGVTTGNVLITSGNVGRDTGVSGSLTDCPTNIFCNGMYVKSNLSWAANSATTGLNTSVDSSTSITTKSGANSLFGISSTQISIFKEIHYGNGDNTIVFFGPSTGFDSNNAAAVVLYQFDTSGRDNWVFTVNIWTTMRRTDSGTEFGSLAKSMMWSREGGTVSTRGSIQNLHADNYVTMAPAGITQDVSGNNLRVIFTGEASKRIEGNYWGTITMHST